MTKRINMTASGVASGGSLGILTAAGNPWSVPDDLANDLVNRGLATFVDTQAKGLVPLSMDPLTGLQYAGGVVYAGPGNTVKQAYRLGSTLGTVIATGGDGIGSAGGWSVTGGTLSTVTDATRPGRTILRATGNTGSGLMTVMRKISSTALTGKISATVKVNPNSAGTQSFWLGFSATAPGADPPAAAPGNTRQLFLSTTSDIPTGIWTSVTAHPGGNRYSTGSQNGRTWTSTETLPSVIQYLEIRLQFDASVPDAEKIVDIDFVDINGYAKPCVVYTFDGAGAYSSLNSYVLPLFKQLGLVGAVCGSASVMQTNKARIDELYAAGWDVVHQALRSVSNYATTPKDLWNDIEKAKAIMVANGWTRSGMDVLMTMPSNARNSTTDTIAADRGIQLVGATGGLLSHSSLPTPGKLAVGRLSLNNATATQANAARAAAILEGSSIVYYGHDFVTTITDGTTQMLQSELLAHVTATAADVAAGNCENVLLSELNRRS